MNAERAREIESWKQEKLGLPHITLKWAQSLDGQLADDDDCSQWISGPEERQYTHWLRSVHEAVLVGAQTFLKDRCQLTVRSIPFAGQQPVRVVADPRGRIYEALEKNPDLFGHDPSLKLRRTYVLVRELKNIPSAHAKDVIFVECRGPGALDDWLLSAIAKLATEFRLRELRPLYGLMVEGGSGILTALLRSEVADTVEIAISPLVLGGAKHRVAPDLRMGHNRRLVHLSTDSLGSDILLRYQVPKKKSGAAHVS